MIRTIALAATLLAIIGCQPEGRIYNDFKDLSPNIEWLKKDARVFKVDISDINQAYDMSLSLRYVTGYPYRYAKVRVTETSPAGKKSVNDYELVVREENGEYIGEPGLDIWDSEHLVEPNKKYGEAGTYSYTIEHIMQMDPLVLVMEIGVILDKAK